MDRGGAGILRRTSVPARNHRVTTNPSRDSEPRDPSRAPGAILFTAFEPSGDAHAAPVIAAIRRLDPARPIYAWGGPKMAAAGAEVVEQTAGDGVIAVPSLARIGAFLGEMRRIETFAARSRVALHVPVDSPAANFPIANLLRRAGARVVHLVAPQFWAWGAWRRKKLQRTTDLVLCLLPFEEAWFRERGIPARFVGHPVINRELDRNAIAAQARELPRGSPRILLLPGSRSSEIKKNLALLMRVFADLQALHHGMGGLIVAASPEIAASIRERHPSMPTGLHVVTAESRDGHGILDAAVAWCDLAITVSGTVSLDVARQAKPMVGVYKTGLVGVLGGRAVLRIPDRLLPNIIAGKRIVPEFVPYAGGPGPIVAAAESLLKDSRRTAEASHELRQMLAKFRGHDFAEESAQAILKFLGGERSGGA